MTERRCIDPCYCVHAYLAGASEIELLQLGCVVEVYGNRYYRFVAARAKNGHHYANCSMVVW